MRSPRRFAAPLVVTVAALTGCAADPPPTANPPPQTVDPPPVPNPPPPPNPMSNPPPPPPPQPVAALPVAADPAHVIKDPDGTCRQFVHVECPKGVMCNPPPPHAVQCPPGK